MKKPIQVLSIVLFVLAGITTPQCNRSEDPPPVPRWSRTIARQVESWVDSGSVIGAELMIIQKGVPLLHRVYGWENPLEKKKLEKNRIFRIHSMTKPVTATAVFMLEESGKLSVDDRVSRYLACYQTEKCREITIRQLLEHTAGFTQPAYPKGSIDLYESLEEAVRDLAARGPRHAPGKAYHYSDGHSATLGLIVSRITGIPVEEWIREQIFHPLEMKDSYCMPGEVQPDRDRVCDTFYWKEGAYRKLWDSHDPPETPFFRASGGIVTTMADYAKFLGLWMNEGMAGNRRLLPVSRIRRALRPGEKNREYGWHWEIYHPSSTPGNLPVFGHGGSSGTLAMALPEQEAMVLYFTQSRGTLTAEFLKTVVLEALDYIEPKAVPEMISEPEGIHRYLGDFQIGSEVWSVERSGKGIVLKSGRLVPLRFVPVSQTEFAQRFMDMRLKFEVKKDEGSCDRFIFMLGEREVEARRVLPQKPEKM